jgi:predicted metal-dependent HD superfamily phosphohydrolase
MDTQLATHWHQLTAPLLPDAARRDAMLHQLTEAYTASGRHYHNLRHVEVLLNAVQQQADSVQDMPVVQLAVWFHDAVYNSLRDDNETRSAELALKFLAETTLPSDRQQRVAFLIERTKDHTQPQPPDDSDLHLFLDADLGILGAPEAAYWEYARQVRQEYRLVPDILYRRGRRKVLEKLFHTPVLYQTETYRTRLDAAARRNLQAELHAWEQDGKLPS